MPNPVEIPRSTKFENQIPEEMLRTTLPGVPYQQLLRDNGRIINTVPNQGFQVGRVVNSSLDFLKSAFFFLSNGLFDPEIETALIKDLENQDNQQATIDILFSIDAPTVRAAWETLIRLVIQRQSSLYRPLLLAGCRKQKWIAGLAPTLAAAAIRFFDSAEAIEHIRRLTGAQVSLIEGAISIDLEDKTWIGGPLQEAFNKADAEIVKALMSDKHVPDSARVDRTERHFYIPETFHDGFNESPEEQRIACLKAMIDCGLRLMEPADFGYDSNGRLGCVLPLDCYNTLDQLFELELVREYEMLLPYSRKFSKSVMVCGILSAAIKGDYDLSEYLAARTLNPDEEVFILKEIALCKTVFFPQDHRYAVLHCLLRNGVDPNIPHLSPFFHYYDETHVDTAVRNHDLEYLDILLDNGLAMDSARVLHTLFRKQHHDERVEPLATRLRTLGFLRDNGLDIRTHGMVALAAFLERGFWTRSESEVSPPLDEILTLLRILLDAAADVNMVIDMMGNKILHVAARARFASPAIIDALIEAGANIQALNLDGKTALHQAIATYKPSRLVIFECLLKHGAVITYQSQDHTILEELVIFAGASFNRHQVDIKAPFAQLLSRGACINNPNRVAGPSALALLIENRMPSELIKMASEADADVNAPVVLTSGLYPVQAAVVAGNSTILEDLLNRGADINAPAATYGGRTALQSACLLGSRSSLTLVQYLIDRGADVNAPAGFQNGMTALQAAAMAGQIDVAKMLIENGAQLDLPPAIENGNLPLDGAARAGRLDMVQYLLNLGAVSQEPGATRYDGAIKLAEREGHYAIADLMREHAARVEEQARWANSLDDAALEDFSTDVSINRFMMNGENFSRPSFFNVPQEENDSSQSALESDELSWAFNFDDLDSDWTLLPSSSSWGDTGQSGITL
jgi:ankyrin repeat protein